MEASSKLRSADWRLAAFVAAVIAAGTAYVWNNYNAAFPQASLSLPLSSGQITAKAEAYLRSRGFSTAGFRNLTLFDPDEDARLYLERELGLERANQLIESQAPVWRWRARWFRPPEKEELLVYLRPGGGLAGFEHRIKESDAGARLDQPAARALAESFLESQTSLPHKLISAQTETRPNRDDHVFTWEQQGFKAKDATIRRTVVMHGDRVGRYAEFLYVPEQWRRDFAKLRSSNELYAGVAQGLYALLAVASLVLLIRGLRQRAIRWRPLVSISAVVAVVYLLNEINTLPFAIDRMATTSGYREMQIIGLVEALGASVGIFLYVLLPAAAGASLYAKRFPQQLPLAAAFTLRGMATRSFFRATVAGFGLAAAHMAFLTAFYLIGSRFGVWSPQEIDYSDVLATPVAWIYPVSTALMASTAEEFWFRLLAIPLVARLVRWRWVAMLAPALLWGFLHANYPQQPGYIRGVEVGIIGVAAAWLLGRFGIVATLVWHYVIDAFLIGLFLFRAEHWLYRLHGGAVALAILAPLIVAVLLYRRHGGFLPEPEPAEPAAGPHAVERAPEPPGEPFRPLLPARYLYITAAAIGLVALVLRPLTFGDFIQVRLSRSEAVRIAAREMRNRDLEPAQWRSVADFTPNLRRTDIEYLRQQLGARPANEVLRDRMQTAVWRVRYFRPLEHEEWLVYVNQQGQAYRVDHVLDEKAPGARLPAPEARRRAEEYLTRRHGVPIHGYTLVDSQEQREERRTDHSFVWEDPSFRAGEARFRVAIQMVGDEPCEYRRFFKIPEQWARDYQKTRLASFLQPALLGAAGVPLLIAFVRRLGSPRHRFHWRAYVLITLAGLALSLAGAANDYPAWLAGYDTSAPLENFYGQLAAGRATSALLVAAACFLGSMAADAFLQMAVGERSLPRPEIRRAAALAALFAAAGSLLEWARQYAPGPHVSFSVWDLAGMDSAVPAVAALAIAAFAAFTGTVAVVILLGGGIALLSPRMRRIMLAIAVVVAAAGSTMEFVQLPFFVMLSLAAFACIALAVATCGADVVSFSIGLFWALALAPTWRYFEQPLAFLSWNGAAAIALAVLAGLCFRNRRQAARSSIP